jgi:hypothetical protein
LYELLIGKAPFGYGNSNPNIIEGTRKINSDMKKGISEEKLSLVSC